MMAPKSKRLKIVRNEHGLYELDPWPMSIEELKAAATKYLRGELPQRTSGQAQWRMERKALLFGGTLIIHSWSDEGLKPPPGKPLTWNAELAAQLIQRAMAGDGEADKVLRDAVNVFLERETLPPMNLREYVKTKFKRNRGNQPTAGRYIQRDHAIADCIKQVLRHSRDPIEATRNVATKEKGGAESACSIVAAAYKAATGKTLKEKSFNVIWGSLKIDYKPSTITARRAKPNT